jgi:hypothetical protein
MKYVEVLPSKLKVAKLKHLVLMTPTKYVDVRRLVMH